MEKIGKWPRKQRQKSFSHRSKIYRTKLSRSKKTAVRTDHKGQANTQCERVHPRSNGQENREQRKNRNEGFIAIDLQDMSTYANKKIKPA